MKLTTKLLIILTISILICLISCNIQHGKKKELNQGKIWEIEKAREWEQNNEWLVGCNFIPSTAINQLEMWQVETFDTLTIDRELHWASEIGMNCVRVYLHHLAWEIDRNGFKNRLNKFLDIADQHGIKTIFVFFDDCWNPTYQEGRQPDPQPGIHNSGWVRDPGDLLFSHPEIITTLEEYVKDILASFCNDSRILLWDLYNEPGNSGYGNRSLPLLQKIFLWAREINPSQPLSSGVWRNDLGELNRFQLNNSDIITYHNYKDEINHQEMVDSLLMFKRPMICTEYMARTNNSLFSNILPILKEQNIGAINWGLVSGKTNTIYAWDTPMPYGNEPEPWFHDIFRIDGTPYKNEEVELIKYLSEIK